MTTEIDVPTTIQLEDAAPPHEAETPIVASDKPAVVSARELQMAEIHKRREEAILKELAYGETLENESHDRAQGLPIGTTQTPAPTDDAEPAPVAEAPKEPAKAATPQVQQDVRIPFEVNGQTYHLTPVEFHQLAQRGAQATMQAQQQQSAQQPPQQPQPQQQAGPLVDEAFAKDIHHRLTYGAEDDGAKALQDLAVHVAQRLQPQPQFDPNEIVNMAMQRTMQMTQFQGALTTVGQEFPEVFSDLRLSKMAGAEVQDARARNAALGIHKPDIDLFREACTTVRQYAPQPRPGDRADPTAPQAASNVEKLERKRAAPQTPSAATRKITAVEAPRAPSVAEIVAQMRQRRGQPVY